MLVSNNVREESRDVASPPADRHLWQITPVRDLFWIGLAVAVLWFVYSLYTWSVFKPVVIALILAYIFNPLITYVQERWQLPRIVTIILLLVILVLAAVGLAIWLVPTFVNQMTTLAEKVPEYLNYLANRYGIQLSSLTNQSETVAQSPKQETMSILQGLLAKTGEVFTFITNFIGNTAQAIIVLLVIPIYFLLFAWHFNQMARRVQHYLPASHRQRILHILERMDNAVSHFFRGRLIIAIVVGVMLAVGWMLVGVPYWFLLGLFTGLLNIVPYFAIIGWPLAVLLKYLDVATGSQASGFSWLSVVVWPSVVYVVIQFLDGWVLTPWIQSQSTDLSAVTVLIVLFIGGAVGGVFGLFLAIPIAAAIKILLEELLLPRLERWAAKS